MLIASGAVGSLGSPRRRICSEIMSILNWNSLDSSRGFLSSLVARFGTLLFGGFQWAPEESLLQVAECYHSLQEACRPISRGSHSEAVAVNRASKEGGNAKRFAEAP